MDKGTPGQIGREVLRILLLEDRDSDAELVERALRKAGFAYTFERARSEGEFLARLDPAPHVIVSDYYVPGCDALHALRLVRARGLEVPFILVSGVIGETRALEAMRLGATDFLLKDRLGRLGSAIRTALELTTMRHTARPKPERTESEFREAFDHAAIGMALTTLDGRWLHVNSAFSAITGYGAEELELTDCNALSLPESSAEDAESLHQLLAAEVGISQRETRYLHKDGHPVWVQVTASLTRDRNGRPLHRMLQVIDIMLRRQTEARLARANRARKVMAECSYALAHATEESQFLQEMCRIVVESGGYVQAYVGLAGDDRRKSVRPVAAAGFEPGNLRKGRRSWSGAGRRRSVMGGVIASGQRFISRDIFEYVKLAPRSGRARSRGYQSLICLPLADGARTIGGISIYAREPDSFDSEEIELLEMLARDIAYGIESLRVRVVLRESEEHFRAMFEHAVVGVAHTTAEGVFLRANLKLCEMLGYSRAELLGTSTRELTLPEDRDEQEALRRELVEGGRDMFSAEKRYIRKDGVEIWASRTVTLARPASGAPYLIQVMQDISERKAAEEALRLSEERYRSQFEASPLPMWVWDDQTLVILSVNPAAAEHYGYSRDEILRMTVRDFWAAEDAARYEEDIRGRAAATTLTLRRRHRVKDGRLIDVEVTARRFVRGGRDAWLTLVNDISVRLSAERALQESEEQFRQLANNIPQVFWITNVAQRETLYLSPAAETLLGYPLQTILKHPRLLVKTVHPADRARVHAARQVVAAEGYDETYRVVRPDGTIRWVHDRAFPVPDASGAIYRIAGIAEDITERKIAEERLLHLAHYDVLTSLPNRVLFYDRLRQALAQAKRHQWIVGVMLIDVDRFKSVNDTLGHAVGDQLLQQVAERLRRSVRAGDTVGRLGGDEFAVVLSNLGNAQDGNLVAQKVMAGFTDPFPLEDGAEIYVTGSIGITLFPDDSTDQDTLIKNADAAMYRAKDAGRNAYRFYTPEMNARAHDLLSLESSLRRALDRGEFLLYYQPKASVFTGAIVGVEALLRWRHPERGLVSAGDFMPVLEETGLIVPVGEWVIAAVCAQIGKWRGTGIDPRSVAINLSPQQFKDKDLCATIECILQEHGVAAGDIEFEITESSLMASTEESKRALEFLANLGVGLSIDDFGTGYSNLGYLKRLSPDALKIDRSFVHDITTSADDATITRAVISMAHSLDLKVIAEGVETEEQLVFLAAHGCDEFQGYYFSRPLAADECGQWLRNRVGVAAIRAGSLQ